VPRRSLAPGPVAEGTTHGRYRLLPADHLGQRLGPFHQRRGIRRAHRRVAHLATRPCLLAVVVPVAVDGAQHRSGVGQLADPVEHQRCAARAGVAQRQAEHGAHVILELAGMSPFDGPVPGIVHARRHLVAEQLAILHKQLQREHADVVEPFGERARQRGSTRLQRVDIRRRRQAQAEHAIGVPVAGERPGAELAVTAAYRQHRKLALERHEGLKDQAVRGRLCAQRRPRRVGVLCAAQTELALAVVTQPPRLEDRRGTGDGQGAIEVGARVDRHELGRRQAAITEQGLLRQAILGHRQRAGVREHRHALSQPVRRVGRHVLEIEGHRVDLACEFAQGGLVVPIGHHQRGDLPGTGVRAAIDHQRLHAERRAGDRQHARQLPATENAQNRLSTLAHARGSG